MSGILDSSNIAKNLFLWKIKVLEEGYENENDRAERDDETKKGGSGGGREGRKEEGKEKDKGRRD